MNGKQTVFVTWFCVFLLLSCLFTNIDAGKTNGRRTGSSSSGRTQRPSTDSKYSNSHADQAKLSYSGYNSAPNPRPQQPVAAPAPAPSHHAAPPPLPPPMPKAPELPKSPDAGKPIGWNVPDGNVQKQTVHNTNAAPYPHQTQQAAAQPPPYSQYPAQGGAPPPYSSHSNVNSHPHDAPPPYTQHAGAPPQYSGAPVSGGYPVHNPAQQGGYQQGGFQQGGYPAQQGGFPAQQGGFPPQQGVYPVQQGGFPVQQGYPAGQYPVQQQKSSGSGLQTALIAGVGGLALYGALKPSEEKTIIINNGVEQKPGDASTTASAASAAVTPVTPVGETPATPVASTAVTPITSVAGSSVSTPVDPTIVNGPTQTAPLAPFPSPATDINTVTMGPPGVPPYNGTTVYYEQLPTGSPLPSDTPLAPLASETSSVPLAPFPSSIPPMCAPGQNPDDPLLKCTPLTVAPMYVTPSTVDGGATAQREASAIPVASNTNQNLQAQSALKSGAVSRFVVAFNVVMIPILTLLMV